MATTGFAEAGDADDSTAWSWGTRGPLRGRKQQGVSFLGFLDLVPLWSLAPIIFFLRVVDVSLGTMRTIAVVQGRVSFAMMLGFIEILVWITAISQVISNISQHPLLPFAYAGGFACGSAAGIMLERKLAIGSTAIRLITAQGDRVAKAVNGMCHVVTIINGSSPYGPVNLIYLTCQRRVLPTVISTARGIDPEVFYVVERFAEPSRLAPLPQPTGWRAVLKKK